MGGSILRFPGDSLDLDFSPGEPHTLKYEDDGLFLSISYDGAVRQVTVRSDRFDAELIFPDTGDAIAVALKRDRRGVALTTENGLAAPMGPEALAHLFDRFYRVDESRSKLSGGYGIGLSVARAIAEKHGGRLTVRQSDDGRRIRFTCRL